MANPALGHNHQIIARVNLEANKLTYMEYLRAFVEVVSKEKNLIDLFRICVESINSYTVYGGKIAHIVSHIPNLSTIRLYCDVKDTFPNSIEALENTPNIFNDPKKAFASYCDLASSVLRTFSYYGMYMGTFSKELLLNSFIADNYFSAISSIINIKIEYLNYCDAKNKIEMPESRDNEEIPPLLEVKKNKAFYKIVKNVLFVSLNIFTLYTIYWSAVLSTAILTAKSVGIYAIKVLYGDFCEAIEKKKEEKLNMAYKRALASYIPPANTQPA